jgi:hypothetical protein
VENSRRKLKRIVVPCCYCIKLKICERQTIGGTENRISSVIEFEFLGYEKTVAMAASGFFELPSHFTARKVPSSGKRRDSVPLSTNRIRRKVGIVGVAAQTKLKVIRSWGRAENPISAL